MSRLDSICEDLFVPSKEPHVIRPLCVMLGYVSTSTIDFLSLNAMEHNLIEYEKDVGDLMLLHTCSENTVMSKYQFLFTQDNRNTRYRRSFFF